MILALQYSTSTFLVFISTRIENFDFSRTNAPTHWLPYYLQMQKMQQRLTIKTRPTDTSGLKRKPPEKSSPAPVISNI